MFGLFKKKLPHCDTLFQNFFSPWYPENERPKMTRPDMYQIAAYEGQSLDIDSIQYLEHSYLIPVKTMVNDEMVEAAVEDFKHITKSEIIDLNFLEAVDNYYDRTKINEIIKESDPKEYSNPYLVTVCEFGAVLGYLFKQIDGYDWLYSYPYFHSIIIHKHTGFGITVFDWAVKKFSEYGVDDGFVAKFQTAVSKINKTLDHGE
jgi:hypothetical protein